jgi:hypothetical protein
MYLRKQIDLEKLIDKIIEELERLELPWQPYKPISEVIHALNDIKQVVKYIKNDMPELKTVEAMEAREVLLGILKDQLWHFLHWLLPANRQTVDIDSFELLNRRLIGIVHYEGAKGPAYEISKQIVREWNWRTPNGRGICNFAIAFETDMTYTVFDVQANNDRRNFKELRGLLEFWKDLRLK